MNISKARVVNRRLALPACGSPGDPHSRWPLGQVEPSGQFGDIASRTHITSRVSRRGQCPQYVDDFHDMYHPGRLHRTGHQ
jgi:hypothetical protein